MSAATARAARPATRTATARPGARPAPRPPAARPPLRVVPARSPRPSRVPFAVAVVGLLATGLLGLLALNTVLAQEAFRLHQLQTSTRALALEEQHLRREVERLRAPAELARRATELGLVQGGPPAFLRLPDGAVLGKAEPATAPSPAAGPSAAPAPAAPTAVLQGDATTATTTNGTATTSDGTGAAP